MKKVLKLFVALAAVIILGGCSEKNDPKNQEKTGQITFSNQSENNYHVSVESKGFVDQFDIEGNKNVTKTYNVTNWTFIIHLTQKDGYILYPTEHLMNLEFYESGLTICWNDDKYWQR